MARGGARPGAGRPRKHAAPPVAPRIAVAEDVEGLSGGADGQTPLDYMLEVMRDRGADKARRDRMAVALAPFLHRKLEDMGKKGERKAAAKVAASGKFAPAAPPKLVAVKK